MAEEVFSESSAGDADTVTIWEPQPRQEAFITCPADDVGFGGARGGGKSDGVIGDFIDHEDTYSSSAIGMAFRRERTQLTELIERSRQVLVPLGYKWHEQDKYFRGPRGGRLRFTYLESDSDADAYQGHSYSRLYPEEMGTFPNEGPINKLQATLRSGNGVPCQMKGTCNPGGPGHQWVKSRYRLDVNPGGFELYEFEFTNPFTKKKVTKTRMFIPSKVTDNKYLGDEYVANLFQVGSRELVRAWLEGDWSVVEGAFFDCWSNERHIIAPFPIPDEWLRFRSADWGSAKPFSVGWWAVVGDCPKEWGGPFLPRGALVRYREWYGASSPNVGLKLTAEEVGRGIKERDGAESIAYGVMDPAAFAVDGGPSIAERMAKEGVLFRRADNRRVSQRGAMGGWDQMRARLKGDGGAPMLYVFSTCRDFIRTVPALQHDASRAEDVDTDGEDHCFAGDTLVRTAGGLYPVADLVGSGGEVWSSDGQLHRYQSVRMTRRNAPIVRLTFSDGSAVRCTPDHLFLTDRGWEQAQFLSLLSLRPSKSYAAFGITGAVHTISEMASGFIASFGRRALAASRTATTFTTRTVIGRTIGRKIWPVCRVLSTSLCTASSAETYRGLFLSASDTWLMNGTAAKPALNGIASTTTNTWPGSLLKRSKSSAITAVSWPRSVSPGCFAQTSANQRGGARPVWMTRTVHALSAATRSLRTNIQRSKPVRALAGLLHRGGPGLVCLSVSDAGRADVYCLTVPDTGNFVLANGAVVHNCGDEARYACMSRPWIPQAKAAAKSDHLVYEARPDGTVVANMSVWDIVEAKRKRKEREA